MADFDIDRLCEAVFDQNVDVRDALEQAYEAGHNQGWDDALDTYIG